MLLHPHPPVFHKEGWFPCKEDDNVKEVFPVRADGIAGHVRGEVDVRAGDDVQELPVVPQHLKIRTTTHNFIYCLGPALIFCALCQTFTQLKLLKSWA